jgi:hypothetical protein
MATAEEHLLEEFVSQLKSSAWSILLVSSCSGLWLGKVIWRPHEDFDTFGALLWGAIVILWLVRCRSTLVGLAYRVPLEQADATRTKTRGIFVRVLAAAFASFCLSLCAGAWKQFGGFLPIAATWLFLTLLLLSVFLVNRRIVRFARELSPD